MADQHEKNETRDLKTAWISTVQVTEYGAAALSDRHTVVLLLHTSPAPLHLYPQDGAERCHQPSSSFVSPSQHSLTAGKLHAVVGPPRTVHSSGSYGPNFTRWLNKHAKLLHSLRVHGPKPEEDDITPGLLAAAAAAGAESASASATSTSVAPQHPSNAPDLPLQSLTCYAPCAGSIFHGLSSAKQLTSLTLRINLAEPWMEIERFSACSDALGTLTSLRQLTLGADSIYGTHPLHQHNFGILYHAWQRLTALTQLDLDPDMAMIERACRGRWYAPVLEADVVKAFPPSLVALRLSRSDPSWREQQWGSGFNDAWDLGHLTSLSVLSFRHLTEGTVLPAGLSILSLANCHSVEPLAAEKLKHLKVLRIMGFSLEGDNVDAMLRVVHGLREVPAFQQLHLDMQAGYSTPSELDLVLKALVGVPLFGLAVNVLSCSMPAQVVSNLGALTRLMGLSLAAYGWQASAVAQLASALRQHRTLQRLHIRNTSRQQGVPQAEASQQQWLQVCQALGGVIGLRHVSIEACPLGDAAAELAGCGTQLIRLSLVRCGVTNTGLIVLGSALRHLLPYNLLIDERPPLEPGCVIA